MTSQPHPGPRPPLAAPLVLSFLGLLAGCAPDASAKDEPSSTATEAAESGAPEEARKDIRDLVNALTPLPADAGPSEQRAWYLTRKRTLDRLMGRGRAYGEEALRVYRERGHAPAEVRAGLLEVASNNAPDAAVDILIELVTVFGEELHLRTQAAEFLGNDSPERAVEVLGPILDGQYDGRTYPPEDQLLEAWVAAMKQLEKDPVPLLANIATDLQRVQEVRHLATQRLGDFPGPQSRQALEELLVESSYNSYVRRKAAQALRASLEPAEFCAIIRGIIDREADPVFQVFLDSMLSEACR